MTRRIVIVDDDGLSRRGLADCLADHPSVQVVASGNHDEALTWGIWGRVDMAVVDAADVRRPDDEIPGVAVVEHLRRADPAGRVVVVVLTNYFFDSSVRRRMKEAGADALFWRLDFADERALVDSMLRIERGAGRVPGPSGGGELDRLGVVEATAVNAAVTHAKATDLLGVLQVGSRNQQIRARQAFGRVSRLAPVTASGLRRLDEPVGPSGPQIKRFLQWAMRVSDRRGGPPTG